MTDIDKIVEILRKIRAQGIADSKGITCIYRKDEYFIKYAQQIKEVFNKEFVRMENARRKECDELRYKK